MNPSSFPSSSHPTQSKLRAALAVGAILVATAACSSSNLPIGKDTSDAGGDSGQASDGGRVVCGTTTCPSGDLCCESADETCSLTCMKVTSCPVFGRDCKAQDSGAADTGADARPDAASDLHWYATCGAPVCQATPADAGPPYPGCPGIGATCSSQGDTCGTASNANCDSTLVCDNHDPKGAGGEACPISTSAFKDGIDYVGGAELRSLHDQAVAMKLATYNYKAKVADPHPKHLGFIIEDQPQSLAVDQTHHRVDLYGYVSMMVAAMQVQEKEITELREELHAAQGKSDCTSGRP